MRHTRSTFALITLFAISPLVASAARAQDHLPLAVDMILDSGALLQPRGVQFGPAINGIAHQSEATVTLGNYQYATWYHLGPNNEDLYLGRREIGSTNWEVMDTGQNFERGDAPWWDNHNVTVLGVSGDGSIHLSFDHHDHPLQYMRTNPGAATGATWDSSLFLPVRSSLDGVSPPITPVTYPRFIENPNNGDSLMTYRTGKSGNGNLHIASYDTDTGQWNTPHQFINGQTSVYTDVLGSSSTRNAYLNGLNVDPSGRMHTTWTWREGGGGSNHDIAYAYSDDNGDTWKNNAGQVVGTPGSPIHLDSPGITVVPLNRTNTVMNQQTQIVDADGGVHAIMWHASDANANAVLGYSPAKSSYFHYFRDPGTQLLADYFDGSGSALNGHAPDATLNGAAWETGSTFLDNGVAQTTVSGSVSGQAAHLDFAPEAGRVYTAEATIVNNQSNWVGFGFMTAEPAAGDWTQTSDSVRHSNGRGYGWMLSRNKTDADQEAFLGAGAANKQTWSDDIVDPTQPVDMKVVLDTRGDHWTVEWYLNGESQGEPVAYNTPGNPGIGGIGFSHERSATPNSGATLSNFSLREGETVGQWLRNELPTERAVGSRPDVGVDSDGNLYAVYVSPGSGDGDGVIPIYTNGDVVIATASKATRWQDWEIVHIDGRDFVGEPRLDHARLRENGIVSIFVQENGDSTSGPIGTSLHILEYNQLANKIAWHGGNTNVWDGASGVENWDRLGNNSSNSDFSNVAGERVDFDDDAETFNVQISGVVAPGSTSFRNVTQNYTLTGGSIGGSGNLRVAGGGTVTLAGAANSYTGDTNVEAGTLALVGSATIAASTNLRLSNQATLDVSSLNGGLNLSQGQTLHVADSSKVVGIVTAGNGSSIVNATGTVEGHLSLASGATLQIGGTQLRSSIVMESDVIDDFSSNSLAQYTGTVILDSDVSGGPNTASWQISAGALRYQTTSYQSIEQSVLVRNDTTLEVGEEIAIDADHNGGPRDIGLYVGGTAPEPGVREDFISIYARDNGEVLSRGFNGTTEFARAGGTVPEYDRLFIARTGENSYETGYYVGNERTVIVTRTPTTANAGTVVGLYADVSGGGTLGLFDNFAKLNPVTVWEGDQFSVDGDFVLNAGALVQFDIASDGANDKLLVTGSLQAGGVLQVTLDSALNSLVDLTAGQSWDLIDFSSAAGAFDSFLLPTLAAGLFWDTSELLVEGVLSITDVAGTILGDFNSDGIVNLADYTVWRDQLGADQSVLPAGSTNDGSGIVDAGEYLIWKQHFGSIASQNQTAISQVPEPTAAWICAMLVSLLLGRRHIGSRLRPALVQVGTKARTGASL